MVGTRLAARSSRLKRRHQLRQDGGRGTAGPETGPGVQEGAMPDEYQPGWHHVGIGDMTGFLIAYGAILLILALVAAGLWLAHRRGAARNAPVHRWPTASLCQFALPRSHGMPDAPEARMGRAGAPLALSALVAILRTGLCRPAAGLL